MDSSSTLLSLCVTGLGTTLGVAETQHILHQQQPQLQPQPQPQLQLQNQRRSVLTTALRQTMECMLRVAVRTLTASALLGKDIFTTALLTQSLILSWDFVTLQTLLSVATIIQQQLPQVSQRLRLLLPRGHQLQQHAPQQQAPQQQELQQQAAQQNPVVMTAVVSLMVTMLRLIAGQYFVTVWEGWEPSNIARQGQSSMMY